jgi:predicted nucleic acid-binding protein
MIVVDASVLANAFTDDGPAGAAARTELAQDPRWAAPDHLRVQAFSAIRGRWRRGEISAERAEDAWRAVGTAHLEVVATATLLPRMWELRDNISGYAAAYVAAAEARQCRLVTADARLAHAPELRCEVTLVAPDD